jgi:hypothetical protein
MKFYDYYLVGRTKNELNTELRYVIASARVDSQDLVCLNIATDGEDIDKILRNTVRILASLRREGLLQIYMRSDKINGGSQEAEFLKNKFSSLLKLPEEGYIGIYVKP